MRRVECLCLSFDPNDSYGSDDIDYYTLWHFKSGKWTSYGKLPHQNPIHWFRARPFQIKLEVAKWGLNAGWHIIHVYSSSEHGTDMPTNKKILRFRHTGSRIIEGQTGYKEPNYYDDNWEILDEKTFLAGEYGDWFQGTPMGGRGVYRPDSGLVYDAGDRMIMGFYDYPIWISCWDNEFYNHLEYSADEESVQSPSMNTFGTWPGTSNSLLNSYYQGYDNDWQYKMPIFFNPSSHSDDQPWSLASNLPSYTKNWLTLDSRSWPNGFPFSFHWRSNFWMLAISFNYGVGEEFTGLAVDNYIIYQGPANWRTLNSAYYENPPSLENSMWDWAWDGSCAESNFQAAYVRRKSDGSIWRFRNWKPIGDVYTDFTNLTMRPTEPIPGVEYASFFMNGPPIPGNETWNTLMVLK